MLIARRNGSVWSFGAAPWRVTATNNASQPACSITRVTSNESIMDDVQITAPRCVSDQSETVKAMAAYT